MQEGENVNEGVVNYIGKGFGFLQVKGRKEDLFFHTSGLVQGVHLTDLSVGQNVSFEDVIPDDRDNSRSKAVGVRPI